MDHKIGWICLHRVLLDWEWYDDHNTTRLFIHLLLSVNLKQKKWRGITINTGSILTGRKKLSKNIGLSEQQIRTSLKRLQSTNVITIKVFSRFSIISMTKWDKYQVKSNQPTNKLTNKQPASNQQPTNSQPQLNNVNNGNKEESKPPIPPFEIFWEDYPRQRRGSKSNAMRAWEKALKENRATEGEILNGVQNYRHSSEVSRGYAKGAAAWLNDDRWSTDYKYQARHVDSEPDKLSKIRDEMLIASKTDPH